MARSKFSPYPGQACAKCGGEHGGVRFAHGYSPLCLSCEDTITKLCRGCDKTLPLTRFASAPGYAGGRANVCRPCKVAQVLTGKALPRRGCRVCGCDVPGDSRGASRVCAEHKARPRAKPKKPSLIAELLKTRWRVQP